MTGYDQVAVLCEIDRSARNNGCLMDEYGDGKGGGHSGLDPVSRSSLDAWNISLQTGN